MNTDKMIIEVLADGTLKISTDQISGANHMSAEAFLRDVAADMGGKQERTRKAGAHNHAHSHGGISHTH